MTTTNDAALRLRNFFRDEGHNEGGWFDENLDAALAAEYEMGWKHGAADQEPRTRRATVERIRADILVSLYGDNHEPGPMPPYLAAILAAGAER